MRAVVAFVEDMAAQSMARISSICRAGATTLAELAAVGVGIDPDSVSRSRSTITRRRNARALSEARCGDLLVPQAELTLERLAGLLRDPRSATAARDGPQCARLGQAGCRRAGSRRRVRRSDERARVMGARASERFARRRIDSAQPRHGGAGASDAAQGQARALRGHRRRRHERHRRSAAQSRLRGERLGLDRRTRRPGGSRSWARGIARGHAAENVAGADVVVVSTAVRADNPEVVAARELQHPGGAARADAGRADALQAGRRGGRDARQDHDHEPGRQRAGRGRDGSDLRDRRTAGERRLATRSSAAASSSWSKPTNRTRRSCTCSRCSRS